MAPIPPLSLPRADCAGVWACLLVALGHGRLRQWLGYCECAWHDDAARAALVAGRRVLRFRPAPPHPLLLIQALSLGKLHWPTVVFRGDLQQTLTMRRSAGIDGIAAILLEDFLGNVDGIIAARIQRDVDININALPLRRI